MLSIEECPIIESSWTSRYYNINSCITRWLVDIQKKNINTVKASVNLHHNNCASPFKCEIQIQPRHNYSNNGDVMLLTRFSKLFSAELIKAAPPLIKLFVFAKRSPLAHCCLLMSSCVTAPCLLIEGAMKVERWKKNDPVNGGRFSNRRTRRWVVPVWAC